MKRNVLSLVTVVKENYKNAIDTLTTRFGNKQSCISAHMKELRMLKAVHSLNDVNGMRKMYDTLELNINNLKELEVDVSTYGSLLIAIVFDCIPEELRIKISLKFGEEDWNLDDTMEVFKGELEARERSLAISCIKDEQSSQFESNYLSTTHGLQLKR